MNNIFIIISLLNIKVFIKKVYNLYWISFDFNYKLYNLKKEILLH